MSDRALRPVEAQCQGKHGYPKRSLAQRVVARSRGHNTVYHCQWCGLFHLGHEAQPVHRPRPAPPEIRLEDW